MRLTTLGFMLACTASAFMAAALAAGQPENIPVVLIPIVIAAFPMLAARTQLAKIAAIISGLTMLAFSVLKGFTIGLFYLPSAITIMVAVFLERREDDPRPGQQLDDGEFWSQRGGEK
jgi:hypothetical protein